MSEYLVKFKGDEFVSDPPGVSGLKTRWNGERDGYVISVDGDGGGGGTPTNPTDPNICKVWLLHNEGYLVDWDRYNAIDRTQDWEIVRAEEEACNSIKSQTFYIPKGQSFGSMWETTGTWFEWPWNPPGMRYIGFFLEDGTEFSGNTIVTADTVAVARYERELNVPVVFVPCGGRIRQEWDDGSIQYFEDYRYEVFHNGQSFLDYPWSPFPTWERDGYTFEGWFWLGEQVFEDTVWETIPAYDHVVIVAPRFHINE